MKIKNKVMILKDIKYLSIIVMSIFYINVGIKHFTDPYWFLHIIPPFLERVGLELVYISGYFEIVSFDENQLVGGDVDNSHSIVAQARLTRMPTTNLEEYRGY